MEFAAEVLGPGAFITGACKRSGTVIRVQDARGSEYIVKHHESRIKHDREVRAYQRWTPALGEKAPQLVAASSPARIIVVTALAGDACHIASDAADIHRQAGALLRAFHDAAQPHRLPGYHDWLAGRAYYWTWKARGLLPERDQAIIGAHLNALAAFDVQSGVPCHLDFQPANWLLDQAGTVRLIDFEHARFDLPVRDFVRLHFRIWATRAELRTAFFAGYGRDLTTTEQQMIWHLGALNTLTALVRGDQYATSQRQGLSCATMPCC
jgi:hypothetical protein